MKARSRLCFYFLICNGCYVYYHGYVHLRAINDKNLEVFPYRVQYVLGLYVTYFVYILVCLNIPILYLLLYWMYLTFPNNIDN